jgi:hypothetical protein
VKAQRKPGKIPAQQTETAGEAFAPDEKATLFNAHYLFEKARTYCFRPVMLLFPQLCTAKPNLS